MAFSWQCDKAHSLNATVVFCLFLAWVGCNIAVGGVHFSWRGTSAYYNRLVAANGESFKWADAAGFSSLPPGMRDASSTCDSYAGGYVFFMALAWILVVIEMVLAVLRSIGKLPGSITSDRSLKIEIAAALLLVFCFFLGSALFGGGCMQPWLDFSDETKMSGFGFVVFCLFLMILVAALNVLILRDPSCHTMTGTGAGSSSSSRGASSRPASSNTSNVSRPVSSPQPTGVGVQEVSVPVSRAPPPARPPPRRAEADE